MKNHFSMCAATIFLCEKRPFTLAAYIFQLKISPCFGAAPIFLYAKDIYTNAAIIIQMKIGPFTSAAPIFLGTIGINTT